MAVERGFRRIVITLSVLLIVVGVALDVLLRIPHTTVRVALNDGRQETIDVQWFGDYPTDRKSLANELSEQRGLAVQAKDIKDVTVLRGPETWWWTDSGVTRIAAGFIIFLWVAFYVVRWIARGFARS